MSYDFDIDNVVQCVKNIVDGHRCLLCDRLEGSRWRYPCGHIACGECVDISISCIHCLSPLDMASPEPVQDYALTKRVEHVGNLLSTCQNTLHVDVYSRQRISDQQKLEKELFPECIQAPLKYSNKRKSLKLSTPGKNKENKKLSMLPGEIISPVKPLQRDKSFSYIHNWLDNIDNVPEIPSRKPLSTLNVNTNYNNKHAMSSPVKRRADLIMDKVYESEMPAIKKKWMVKDDKDESGIVMDDPIIIEDTQDEIGAGNDTLNLNKSLPLTVDKDKQAWLAVLEAEEYNTINNTPGVRLECHEVINYTNDIEKSLTEKTKTQKSGSIECEKVLKQTSDTEQSLSQIISRQKSVNITLKGTIEHKTDTEKSLTQTSKTQNNSNIPYKVPFYKKSPLKDPNQTQNSSYEKCIAPAKSKNVEITIENKNFITTIKVMNVERNKQNKKQSILVQTDISDIEETNRKIGITTSQLIKDHQGNSDKNVEKDSMDLFTAELKLPDANSNSEHKVLNENLKPEHKVSDAKSSPVLKVSGAKVSPKVEEKGKEEFKDKFGSKTVISDSDSADDLNKSETLVVAAEVHRSCDQFDYNVFSELEPTELVSRPRRRKRGPTPHSSDSSDKENRDPNRAKRIKLAKKDPIKKKNQEKLHVCKFC